MRVSMTSPLVWLLMTAVPFAALVGCGSDGDDSSGGADAGASGAPAGAVDNDDTTGDDTAGAVLVKLNTLDGQATAYQRGFDLASGDRGWVVLASGDEAEIDAAIARQRGFDPDLWVIEVEDRSGRHLLEQPGLA